MAAPSLLSFLPAPALFGWRRLRVVFAACVLGSLLMLPDWEAPYRLLLGRLLWIGGVALLAFGLFERWPPRLPTWVPRWGLQVAAVAMVMPFAAATGYALSTPSSVHWWADPQRQVGFGSMTALGMLAGPWIAMAALYRQVSGEARRQALAFELERSEYERSALDARLRQLQAQVQPHFLFNTLANVRELVDTGSPQASAVLGSLIAYLRAAVPRLDDAGATLGQELDLVRAYLEVMHMRMPDRLQFALHADAGAARLHCPPMAVLTLVENAIRHGIDPSEDGGRIEVRARLRGDRCHVDVIDTGAGFASAGKGTGTGLANLRERLDLAFDGDASLRLSPLTPHGTCAEIEFPATGATT
ncbi:MAG: sensor histidine kinase [Luteimonas sp.]